MALATAAKRIAIVAVVTFSLGASAGGLAPDGDSFSLQQIARSQTQHWCTSYNGRHKWFVRQYLI